MCIYLCVHVCHDTGAQTKGQLAGVGSVRPLVSFLGRPQRVGEYLCPPPLLIFRVPDFFFFLLFTAVTCSVKITWYILVLLVFMVGIILIMYKILEDHRRVRRWQRKYWEVTPGHMAFPYV